MNENAKRFLVIARICIFLFLMSQCTLSDYLKPVFQTSPAFVSGREEVSCP